MDDCISILVEYAELTRLGSLWYDEDQRVVFLAPIISCEPPLEVTFADGVVASGVSELALVRNAYGRPCVVLQGEDAQGDLREGSPACRIASVAEGDVPALRQLFARMASGDPLAPVAFADALRASLAGSVTQAVWWCDERLGAFEDAFDELETLLLRREAWWGIEGTLELVDDEGVAQPLPVRPSETLGATTFRGVQDVPFEAALPAPCTAPTGFETKTLFVVLERRRIPGRYLWGRWSLLVCARCAPSPYGLSFDWGRGCLAHRAEDVPGLFAEMGPVPLWLVRDLLGARGDDWLWAEEAHGWVNAEREEWLAELAAEDAAGLQDDEPFARDEDAFWERVDPSRWRVDPTHAPEG